MSWLTSCVTQFLFILNSNEQELNNNHDRLQVKLPSRLPMNN